MADQETKVKFFFGAGREDSTDTDLNESKISTPKEGQRTNATSFTSSGEETPNIKGIKPATLTRYIYLYYYKLKYLYLINVFYIQS